MDSIRQILFLTYFNMRSRYRKTWAGFLWVVSGPILTFLVQSIIFKEIFKFNINRYSLYLLAGLLPWFFISQTLNAVTSCLLVSRDVLLAFKIRPIIIIATQVLDQFLSFLAAFLIICLVLVIPNWVDYHFFQLLTLVLNLATLFYFVLTLTSILSFWHVFYRDIHFVVQFLMGLMFYITPIFYTEELFPQKFSFLLKINIFIPFIKVFQTSLHLWSIENWLISFSQTIFINLFLTVFLLISLKTKTRDFYINV